MKYFDAIEKLWSLLYNYRDRQELMGIINPANIYANVLERESSKQCNRRKSKR